MNLLITNWVFQCIEYSMNFGGLSWLLQCSMLLYGCVCWRYSQHSSVVWMYHQLSRDMFSLPNARGGRKWNHFWNYTSWISLRWGLSVWHSYFLIKLHLKCYSVTSKVCYRYGNFTFTNGVMFLCILYAVGAEWGGSSAYVVLTSETDECGEKYI